MPTLSDQIARESPLGFIDALDNSSVPRELEKIFQQLYTKLAERQNSSSTPIFSCDQYDEQLTILHVHQEDEFANTILANQTPHAVICHMRLYSTAQYAHWHALFAQMDETGELKKIIITDSRTVNQAGITAKPDIENNLFLQQHADKITFIAGEQQPFKSQTCWLYCLANLVALAAYGTVYKKNTKGALSKELLQLLKAEPPKKKETKQETQLPESLETTIAVENKLSTSTNVLPADSVKPSSPTVSLAQAPQTNLTFFVQKSPSPSAISPTPIKQPLPAARPSSFSNNLGLILLSLGPAVMLGGAAAMLFSFPVGFAAGLSLLGIGILLTAIGLWALKSPVNLNNNYADDSGFAANLNLKV
ncbi:hypothetical protein [Legionella septentrionalis]|uniref:hypothetical protein n=1 Tax=Legionella septentrionalis TaxID=2498109 RepID=UPI000F8CAB74|nr:hypothetical protein [Legionella septentrionalis]RUQ99310.1 hypothetical protein ELY11_04595 [Legionella septentrionalis]